MPRKTLSFREKHQAALAEIAEIAAVPEREVFAYSEHPTPTQGRWFFQPWITGIPEARRVCLSREEADDTVRIVLAWCRANPDKARALTENYQA